jgi:hypothetical protein
MAENKEIPEDILKRIKILLAFQADAKKRDSLAELENATQRVAELMMKYNLSMSDIDLEDKPKVDDNEVGADKILVKNEGDWIRLLYHGICRYNFCRAINLSQWSSNVYSEIDPRPISNVNDPNYDSNTWWAWRDRHFTGNGKPKEILGIKIIGEKINIEMAQYIIDQLISRIRPLAKQAWKEYEQKTEMMKVAAHRYKDDSLFNSIQEREKKNTFIRGFLSGAVTGIYKKLKEQRDLMEIEAIPKLSQGNNPITDLIHIKSDAIQKYIDQNIQLTKGKGSSRGNSKSEDGKQKGFRAGYSMDINKGLNTNNLNQNLLT